MAEQFEQEILIDKYLKGRLSTAEQKEFDQYLEQSGEFQEKVKELEVLYNGFGELRVEALVEKLKEWPLPEKEEEKTASLLPSKGKVFRISRRWMAAASVVLIGFLGMTWWIIQFSNKNLSQEAIVKLDASGMRTIAAAPSNSFQEGINHYEKGRFQEAAALFAKSYSEEGNLTAQYFLAYCQFYNGQYDEAIKNFSAVANTEDKRYNATAAWNLVAVYVAKGQFDEQYEKAIDQAGSKFEERAAELEKKRNSFWRKLFW